MMTYHFRLWISAAAPLLLALTAWFCRQIQLQLPMISIRKNSARLNLNKATSNNHICLRRWNNIVYEKIPSKSIKYIEILCTFSCMVNTWQYLRPRRESHVISATTRAFLGSWAGYVMSPMGTVLMVSWMHMAKQLVLALIQRYHT